MTVKSYYYFLIIILVRLIHCLVFTLFYGLSASLNSDGGSFASPSQERRVGVTVSQHPEHFAERKYCVDGRKEVFFLLTVQVIRLWQFR